MKTTLLVSLFFLILNSAKAQFTQNFEGTEADLTNNCWAITGIYKTTAAAEVISGNGSMYTNPPTSGSTRDITTPVLNITSSLFSVSFNYKVSSPINGNATRTIEVGLVDAAGSFNSLQTITMDRNSPSSVQTFNNTFVLSSIGSKRLMLRLGGAQGDGNSRLIFDDLYTNASAKYGNGTCNSAPLAVNDNFLSLVGRVVTGNILANDVEPNAEIMTPSIVNNTGSGLLVLNTNGNFVFTPVNNLPGSITFTYQLVDNGVAPMTSNTATVTINYATPYMLPVKLEFFNAMLNNNKVDLKWATSEEQNVSHFVIEKSVDGQYFTEAGMVFALGNTTIKTDYQFSDNIGSVTSAVIYYRLRSVDIDGKFEYSATRVIRLDKKAENTITILTYPNPVSNELKVTIPANWQNKRVNYELINLSGQSSKKIEVVNSSQTETINTSNLQPGLYFMRVSFEGQMLQQKIIKN